MSGRSVAADATNRAWRTLLQGLLVDVVVAVSLAVLPTLAGSGFAFSAEYWQTVAMLACKSGIVAGVSYIARRVLPPSP